MNHKAVGAALLVTGTTVGAGMLGLPISSHSFVVGVFLLLLNWGFMSYSALVMVDINLALEKPLNVVQISSSRVVKALAILAICSLFYSLLAAYISGLSAIVRSKFELQWVELIIAIICSIFLYSSVKLLDYGNRIAVFIMLLVFSAVLYFLLPSVSLAQLVNRQASVKLYQAIPVFFTAFGFHGSIQSIMLYIAGAGENRRVLLISILTGTAIAAAIYLLWLMVSMGATTSGYQSLPEMIDKLSLVSGRSFFFEVISIFSIFAIITSLLGVAFGMCVFF